MKPTHFSKSRTIHSNCSVVGRRILTVFQKCLVRLASDTSAPPTPSESEAPAHANASNVRFGSHFHFLLDFLFPKTFTNMTLMKSKNK